MFQEALTTKGDHAGALLGLALVAAESYGSDATELAERALRADSNLAEGHELLARLALEDGNVEKAAIEADQALSISPDALYAMSIHATVDWLRGESRTPWVGRILQRNPSFGEVYQIAGRFFVLRRRYEDATQFYRKSITVNPQLWSAYSELGCLLFRMGADAEAREYLEKAFKNDPYDVVTFNMLQLMDREKGFVTFKSGESIVRLPQQEARSQQSRVGDELQNALKANERRYRNPLRGPVVVKFYSRRDDFSVFTFGAPGAEAFGSTFGRVIAIDGSEGRPVGTELWKRTLWWQLGVAFVEEATEQLAPNWFTLGMAETGVPPQWREPPTKEILLDLANEGLLSLAGLERALGLRGPKSRRAALVAAEYVCDFIEREWGQDKLLAMTAGFARGETTAHVVQEYLRVSVAEIERRLIASAGR